MFWLVTLLLVANLIGRLNADIDLSPLLSGTGNITLAPGSYRTDETVTLDAQKTLDIKAGTKIRFLDGAGIEILGGRLTVNCSAQSACEFKNMQFLKNHGHGSLSIEHLIVTECLEGIDIVSGSNMQINSLTMHDSSGFQLRNWDKRRTVEFNDLSMINVTSPFAIETLEHHEATTIVRNSLFVNIEAGIGTGQRFNEYRWADLKFAFHLEVTNCTFEGRNDSFSSTGISAQACPSVNITGNRFLNFGGSAILRQPWFINRPTEFNSVLIDSNNFTGCPSAVNFDACSLLDIQIRNNRFVGTEALPRLIQAQIICNFDLKTDRANLPPPRMLISGNEFTSLRSYALIVDLKPNEPGFLNCCRNLFTNNSIDKYNKMIRIHINNNDYISEARRALNEGADLDFSGNVFANNQMDVFGHIIDVQLAERKSPIEPHSKVTVNLNGNHFLNNSFGEYATVLHVFRQSVNFQHNNLQGNHLSENALWVDCENRIGLFNNTNKPDRQNRTAQVNAQNNWWGTANATEISWLIKDGADEAEPEQHIQATWQPFCNRPFCENLKDCWQMAKQSFYTPIGSCDDLNADF